MTELLIFSIVEIKVDIAFATSVVSFFTKDLSWQYTEVVKTIMHYLKVTKTMRIMYSNSEGKDDLIINGYSNSDWAGDHATRKSTSNFIFMLNSSLIS